MTLGGVGKVGVGWRGWDEGGLKESGCRVVVKEGVELRQKRLIEGDRNSDTWRDALREILRGEQRWSLL